MPLDCLYRHFADVTQLDVELSYVAIDTHTDATQLSPTVGNATEPAEQRTTNQREAGPSCFWRHDLQTESTGSRRSELIREVSI